MIQNQQKNPKTMKIIILIKNKHLIDINYLIQYYLYIYIKYLFYFIKIKLILTIINKFNLIIITKKLNT